MKKITSFLMLFLMCFGVGTVKADNVLLNGTGENPLPGTLTNGQFHWISGSLTGSNTVKVVRLTFLDNSNAESTGNSVYPFVAISELKLFAGASNEQVKLTVDNLKTTVSQGNEGDIKWLVDNDNNDKHYWHSSYSTNHKKFHYLDIVVPAKTDLSTFKLETVSRRAQGAPSVILVTTGTSEQDVATQADNYFKTLVPEMTTDENNPHFYSIRNMRTDKNMKFVSATLSGENRLTLAPMDRYSRWYFTEVQEAGLNAGVKAVNIHNAATAQVIKGHTQNPWGDEAKTYYIVPKKDQSGFVISTTKELSNDNSTSWNNFQGGDTQVDTWNGNDGGSVWQFAPVEVGQYVINKTGTVDGLMTDLKTKYTAQIEAVGNSSAFVYTKENLDACKAVVNGAAANTYAEFVQARQAMDKAVVDLFATGTFADGTNLMAVVGDRYMSTDGTVMVTPNNKNLYANVWQAKSVEGTAYLKLYNPYSKKYAGQVLTEGGRLGNGLDVPTNVVADPQNAGIYQLVHQAGGKISFKCTNPQNGKTDVAGDKDCLHKGGSNTIVRWTAGAENSQWTLTKVTPEEIAAFEEGCKNNLVNAVANVDKMTASPAIGYYHVVNQAAIDAAKDMSKDAANHSGYELDQAAKNLTAALAVNMPVSGKAYTFTAIDADGHKFAMAFNGTKMEAKAGNKAAVFVCKQVEEGKFVFVTNEGKYFAFYGDNGVNEKKGFTDNYDANYSVLDLVPLWNKKISGNQAKSAELGWMGIIGKYNDKDASYLILRQDGRAHQDGNKNAYIDGAGTEGGNPRTSAFLIEEAAYANQPEMKAIGANDLVKIGDATKVATFSAPFATVVPANVKAYYVSNIDNTYNVARLAEVEAGKAVPAYQGVILATASEMTNAVMIPATTEAVAEIMGNQLEGTAGASKTLAAGKGYILTAVGGVVGLYKNEAGDVPMNKAYLPIVENLGSSAMKLVFGDEVTGIEGVEAVENENAPIYDLSGRRVMNTVKGGIYIQNGKKFIVK